uniref:MIF4G domain-containing protein n=1 Tax=Macrostomum lignano TaxID=282301 RepID=A0A1I8F296_9PLAT
EDSDDSDADFYTSISDDADDDDLDDDAHSITSQSVAPTAARAPVDVRARQLASAGRPLLRTRLAGQKLNETNLALLYITCQLEASVASPIVCLSHLLHLVAVGQVPYFDALRRLPERYCVTEPGVAAMLRRSSAPRYDTLVEIVARLSSLLSIRVFPGTGSSPSAPTLSTGCACPTS